MYGGSTYQSCQLGNTLHHAPQHAADNNESQKKTGGASFRVGRARADEETCTNAAGDTNHGHLVVAQLPLGPSMAADAELRLVRVFVLVLEVLGLLGVLDAVVSVGGRRRRHPIEVVHGRDGSHSLLVGGFAQITPYPRRMEEKDKTHTTAGTHKVNEVRSRGDCIIKTFWI